jgi:beta-fructofuranosidase
MILLKRRDFLAAGLTAPATGLASDPHRPRFHFLPPANWMNDPNGPLWWQGWYHMFYQHNPKAARWDTMHWGHAVSPDLLHWRHRGIALAPTPGGPDKDGCFTGCAVANRGTPSLIYTGVRPEVQCLATSGDPMLDRWVKRPRPVIAAPPPGLDTPGFRDPQVWREGADWLLALGAGFRGQGGAVLLYRSPDLVDWTYLKPLYRGEMKAGTEGGEVARGEMWECPDFFPVQTKHLLYVSTENTVRYWLGRYDRDRSFGPEDSGVLLHGAAYAPKSCLAADGRRRLIWSWLREQRGAAEQLRAGWSGVLSLAAVPSLGRDGRLRLSPAREYARLRRAHSQRGPWPEDCCEFQAVIDARRAFRLVRGGKTLAGWDPSSSRLSAGPSSAEVRAPHFRIHAFLDGSVIEVFTSEPVTVTGRVYGSSGRIEVEGDARHVEAWALEPISPDRLTG